MSQNPGKESFKEGGRGSGELGLSDATEMSGRIRAEDRQLAKIRA